MELEAIYRRFTVPETAVTIAPYGNGHINDTYLVRAAETPLYILQRVNRHVFPHPEQVMENIIGVTDFLSRKLTAAGKDARRGTLHLVPCRNGEKYYRTAEGDVWRLYDFVTHAVSLDKAENEHDFYESAVAFGQFQRLLQAYPVETLHETIPDFHNTPVRYAAFCRAVDADAAGRAGTAAEEIAFVQARREFMSRLEEQRAAGVLPLKVTHNDTKLNNVMLDEATREPVCVIDLDTVMPGYAVNDFGDSIRFGASTAAEDEPDLDKVHFDLTLFTTYTRGFLAGCAGTLTSAEVENLPVGAKMMTLECGMRFLTDYLQGDTYFKTRYPEHNLVRCRTQFRLVAEMEQHWEEMQRIVASCAGQAK